MSTNDITGDRLISKVNTEAYDKGYDSIFKKTKEEQIEADVDKLEEYLDKCKEKKGAKI